MSSSPLYKGELIINDATPDSVVDPGKFGKGLELGRRTTPYGQMRSTTTFPKELLVPRSEWQARIKEMEEQKSRHSDIVTTAGLPCKDQDQTNYCWINAPTYAVESKRVVQGQKMVILSPASAGGPIKNFRNVGGWGEEGLSYIAEFGLVPVDLWPANAIKASYNTAANRAVAMNYRCTEWWELVPRNLDELISCLFLREPVAVGYNWWGHEVTGCDPVWLDGEIALRIRNSWAMSWGSQGFGILQGKKMLPDDAVVPRVVTASA
jgi:hypothetical protein